MERIAMPDRERLPSDTVLAPRTLDHRQGEDRRRHRRLSVALPAQVVLPDGSKAEGRIVSVSAGGAELSLDAAPNVDAAIIVYADRLGRLEGRVLRATREGVILTFPPRTSRAKRLADALTWIANFGPDRDRRGSRRYGRDEAATLIRANGDAASCRILDISTTGASVGIDAHQRPAIGEAVTVGVMAARVVRHHADGIGVAFAPPAPNTPAPGTPTSDVTTDTATRNDRAVPGKKD